MSFVGEGEDVVGGDEIEGGVCRVGGGVVVVAVLA